MRQFVHSHEIFALGGWDFSGSKTGAVQPNLLARRSGFQDAPISMKGSGEIVVEFVEPWQHRLRSDLYFVGGDPVARQAYGKFA
jgi:hypothetical protein